MILNKLMLPVPTSLHVEKEKHRENTAKNLNEFIYVHQVMFVGNK